MSRALGALVLPVALGALVLGACGSDDESTDAAGVTVSDAWARATAGQATMGAVYFTIESDTADALIGAEVPSEVAGSAEIHESTVGSSTTMGDMEHEHEADAEHSMGDHDMATMRPVDSIELAPGSPVTFEPGGYHVMLIDLVEPLVEGDTFELTLDLETADSVTVEVEVRT
jgi:copper(I)-binding protein